MKNGLKEQNMGDFNRELIDKVQSFREGEPVNDDITMIAIRIK